MKLFFFYLFVGCFLLQDCSQSNRNPASTAKGIAEFYTAEDFYTIKKIDAHLHLYTGNLNYAKQAAEDNFSLITINLDDVNEPPPMEVQQQLALQQVKAFPNRVAYATTISVRHFNDSNWQQQTIAYLNKLSKEHPGQGYYENDADAILNTGNNCKINIVYFIALNISKTQITIQETQERISY